jgi:hypothetical protein
MAATSLKGLVLAGFDILATTVSTATKKITAQLGSVVGETSDSDEADWWQHVGFASRPAKPEAGKSAAQAVIVRQGDRDAVIASQDLRGLELYGNLRDGETCIYAPGADGAAQARVLLKADGSINLLTRNGNDANGASVGVFIAADGSITLAGTGGAAVMLGNDGGVKLFNAGGALQLLASGKIKIASTAKVDISGPGVTIGGPAALPVAMAAQTIAALSALQTAVSAIAAQFSTLAAPAAPAVAAAAATAAASASASAVSSAAALIPSKRVSVD